MNRALNALILTVLFFTQGTGILFAQDTRNLEREKPRGVQSEKRTALVIGNGSYLKVSPLDNPVNDANDMAAALKTLGFDVIKGADATLVQMRRLIREFGETLEAQKGIGLFYYAGHGVEVRGKNFLVPVDADIAREVETEDYAIDVNSILRHMDAAGNGFNIVVLDACRNNPFSRGWNRSGDAGGLANVNAPTGTYIAYAAAPGSVASDGKGTRNGVFTGSLIKQLKRPNLKLEEVFKATREEVMTLTANKQVPWDSSSVKGDFYFNATAGVPASNAQPKIGPEPTIVAKSKAEQESEAWDLVKNSAAAADFRFFLEEFPNGANSAKARIRLEELVWDSVRNSGDNTRVQAYLNEFPDGANASSGRIRLRQLEAAANPAPVKLDGGNTAANKTAGSVSKATLPGNVEMSFAYIPAGEFQMGSNNGESDEKPVHTVKISQGFWMQTTEVTQAQWKAMMGMLPSKCDYGELKGDFLGDNKPIVCISWDDAQEFVRQMNLKNDGYKYRLPTEAEWEYAARAGTTGDYAGYLDGMAWYANNSGRSVLDADEILKNDIRNYVKRFTDNGNSTHDVGTKQANGWGLFDMHGNVWEWCQDWYGDYPGGTVTDPTGAASGSDRVVRGGGWSDSAGNLRSAYRGSIAPSYRSGSLGFRLLRN